MDTVPTQSSDDHGLIPVGDSGIFFVQRLRIDVDYIFRIWNRANYKQKLAYLAYPPSRMWEGSVRVEPNRRTHVMTKNYLRWKQI